MDDMDMDHTSHGDSMDASHMNMVFFAGYETPLYATGWKPMSGGAYAGTCIFLVILAIIFRLLNLYKKRLEQKWVNKAWQRRYIVVADRQPVSEELRRDPDAKTALLTANGVEENVKVVHKPVTGAMPWRFSTDLPRALLYTLIVGVGYLLMLAVMTMNVGYFLSILAGSFIGELAVGRYIASPEEHH